MMNLYVWNRVDHVSHSYHHEGGIAVIAATFSDALQLIASATADIADACGAFNKPPDLARPCEGPPYIKIFPDAGCC